MNERIRELMHQSNPSGDFSECEWVFENFAELVLQECISALDEADGSIHHSECLLEHFGVEQ